MTNNTQKEFARAFKTLNGGSEESIIKDLEKEAGKYDTDQYNLFESELGWQDWMNKYTEAKDGEECSESEIEEINKIIKKAWSNIHNN